MGQCKINFPVDGVYIGYHSLDILIGIVQRMDWDATYALQWVNE